MKRWLAIFTTAIFAAGCATRDPHTLAGELVAADLQCWRVEADTAIRRAPDQKNGIELYHQTKDALSQMDGIMLEFLLRNAPTTLYIRTSPYPVWAPSEDPLVEAAFMKDVSYESYCRYKEQADGFSRSAFRDAIRPLMRTNLATAAVRAALVQRDRQWTATLRRIELLQHKLRARNTVDDRGASQ